MSGSNKDNYCGHLLSYVFCALSLLWVFKINSSAMNKKHIYIVITIMRKIIGNNDN